MSLKDVLNDATNAIKDLSSLEVQTYVGELNVEVSGTNSTDLEALLTAAKTSGNLKLAQVTRISIDGDATNLVSSEPLPDHVLQAHQTAVQAGDNVRKGMIELFSGLIDKG